MHLWVSATVLAPIQPDRSSGYLEVYVSAKVSPQCPPVIQTGCNYHWLPGPPHQELERKQIEAWQDYHCQRLFITKGQREKVN